MADNTVGRQQNLFPAKFVDQKDDEIERSENPPLTAKDIILRILGIRCTFPNYPYKNYDAHNNNNNNAHDGSYIKVDSYKARCMLEYENLYENLLPPLSILNEKDEKELISNLEKLNFSINSLMAA